MRVTKMIPRARASLPTLWLTAAAMLLSAVACSEHGIVNAGRRVAEIAVIGGDAQGAPVGTRLAHPIAVRVVDADDAPVRGAILKFTVASGAGTLEHGQSAGGTLDILTDELGDARARWTLGPSAGVQTVEIEVAGSSAATPVVIEALAGTVSPAIEVTILEPVVDEAADELDLRARTSATLAISSVVARVGHIELPLVFAPASGEYVASIPIADVPRDTLLVSVSAQDASGQTSVAFRRYFLNRVPEIVVASPLGSSVARPMVSISATCTDDDPAGCASLTVFHDGAQLAQGTSAVNGTFALTGSGSTWLRFRAVDSDGRTIETLRRVFVEPAQSLHTITTARGVVLDYRDDRVLFIDSTLASPRPVIRTGATSEELVPSAPFQEDGRAYLVPGGALLIGFSGFGMSGDYAIRHWRNGTMTVTSPTWSSLSIAGDWALFQQGASTIRRDLLTGTEFTIATNRASDVAASGAVVYQGYFGDNNLLRYRDGVHAPLTTDDDSVNNTSPRTDGTVTIYQKGSLCCNPTVYRIAMHDGVSEIELAPPRTRLPVRDRDYAVNGGWTAFTRPDAQGRLQVWTRSPAGTVRQVSALGIDARIEALGPEGTVIMTDGSLRYRSTATTVPTAIMSNNGVVRWQGTRFLVLLGNAVLAIQ